MREYPADVDSFEHSADGWDRRSTVCARDATAPTEYLISLDYCYHVKHLFGNSAN
jgi:hypothetical protein